MVSPDSYTELVTGPQKLILTAACFMFAAGLQAQEFSPGALESGIGII